MDLFAQATELWNSESEFLSWNFQLGTRPYKNVNLKLIFKLLPKLRETRLQFNFAVLTFGNDCEPPEVLVQNRRLELLFTERCAAGKNFLKNQLIKLVRCQ